MSETADARGSKRARPEEEQEQESGPAVASGFAPVPARRTAPAPATNKVAPVFVSNETTQYQVPLELLVLARNKEKDKARSVAVTPVAPAPSADEPPPSSELSALRAQTQEAHVPASDTEVPPPAKPFGATMPSAPAAAPRVTRSSNSAADSHSAATMTWLLVTTLLLTVGYFAFELLYLQ
jgi:hypothetical protein